MKENWTCLYFAKTHRQDGSPRKLYGAFDGSGDLMNRLLDTLEKRLRKPWIWYGVGIVAVTPIGQRAEFIIEQDEHGYLVLENDTGAQGVSKE